MSEYIVEIPFDNFKDAAILHGSVDGSRLRAKAPLNENQQIVLDYLTIENRLTKEAPLLSINNFAQDHFGAKLPEKVEKAYRKLNVEEDYQVLAAFAEWGCESSE